MNNLNELSRWLGARAETFEGLSAVDRQKMVEAAEALKRLVDRDSSEGDEPAQLAHAQAEVERLLLEREQLAMKLFACRWLLRHYRSLQGSVKKLNPAAIIADLEQAVEHGRTATPVPETFDTRGRPLSERERASLLNEALRMIKHAGELLKGAEIRHLARAGVISGADARRFEEALLNPDRVSAEDYERAREVFERVGPPVAGRLAPAQDGSSS